MSEQRWLFLQNFPESYCGSLEYDGGRPLRLWATLIEHFSLKCENWMNQYVGSNIADTVMSRDATSIMIGADILSMTTSRLSFTSTRISHRTIPIYAKSCKITKSPTKL